MGCGVYYQQIRELERAMGSMRRFGISELDPSYLQLGSIRGKLLKQVGSKLPRTITQLLKLTGLSPGTITLWHDVESGFMVEARERPGAPPVYHYVKDDIAAAILKDELTHEQFEELKVPDPYLGE